MDPSEIDWNNIVSFYERDEVYEPIDAPKWRDFSAPDAAIDDVKWFCRADCRHPISYEDFDRWNSNSEAKVLRSDLEAVGGGEKNNNQRNADLKWRGGIVPFLPSKPKLNFGGVKEDFENQNPNLEATPLMMKGKKMAVAAKKEAIKSSAEKKMAVVEDDVRKTQSNNRSQPQPRLKSTFSERSLYFGKDILRHINEFCYEIKKLATGKVSAAINEEEKEKMKEVFEVESKADLKEKMEEKKSLISTKKTGNLKKRCDLAVKFDSSVEKKNNLLKEVRAYPPTPQRFPSLSSNHRQLKSSKASPNSNTSSSSPLSKIHKSKTLKQERGVLHELDQRRGEENIEVNPKNEECIPKESTADVFWFLKPCAYLS